MSFIRCLSETQIEKMLTGENGKLFERLKKDIVDKTEGGEVFPAIRKNELHFYYRGGCLYKFKCGAFSRNKNYDRYNDGTEGLDRYEKAKKQNENKFTSASGGDTERMLLDRLYCGTFFENANKNPVVLDVEINLNGEADGGQKCDLALFNPATCEIMFVEGKVFYDYRVNVKKGNIPKVIAQVETYSKEISAQRENILEQYRGYIEIINRLFGSAFPPPVKIIQPVKLLIFGTPLQPTENQKSSIKIINKELGEKNTAWFLQNETPDLQKIWSALCK